MVARLTPQERAWRAVGEKAYQAQIMDLARTCNWLAGHWSDSRKQVRPGVFVGDKDAAGVPDLVMVHPIHGIAFVEVKKELGKVSEAQETWLNALLEGGVPAVVARPSTFDVLQRWIQHGFPPASELRGCR